MRKLILISTHAVMLVVGFALGVYLLPILTAPDAPDEAQIQQSSAKAIYSAEFKKDLEGSDFLHWGEGTVSVTPVQIVHEGELAPGPDYKLYLAPDFVESEESFLALKSQSVQIGDVKTFKGFILDIPEGVDVAAYNTVVVWCEAFGEFISAAKYQ